MTKFINYDRSIILKDLGFKEGVFAKWVSKKFQWNALGGEKDFNSGKFGKNIISCPTLNQALEFLMFQYGFHYEICRRTFMNDTYEWNPFVYLKGEEKYLNDTLGDEFYNFQEAQERCLEVMLKYVKSEK